MTLLLSVKWLPAALVAFYKPYALNIKVKLFPSPSQLGGQPAIFYPENEPDVPGFTNLTEKHLSWTIIHQLETFETDICLNELFGHS